jgi:predicted RNA-binding Zn-ribbon protein involved in translation (DUF1610 family)
MADDPKNTQGQQPDVTQATATAKPRQSRLGMVFLCTIACVALAAYLSWSGWTKQGIAKPVNTVLKCATTQCAYMETRPLRDGETLPSKCPKCGAQSVFLSMRCPKCGTQNILNEVRGLPGPSTCSKCGTELHYGE